jgi:hypothetical protein
VPAEIILPVQVVDAADCANWNVPFEARPSPDWNRIVGAGRVELVQGCFG